MRPLYLFLAGTLLIQGTLFFMATYWARSEMVAAKQGQESPVVRSDAPPAPENLPLSQEDALAISPTAELPAVVTPNPPIVYKVQAGDTLGGIWRKNGALEAGAIKAAEAFKAAGVDVRGIQVGEELQIEKSEDGTEIISLRRSLGSGKTVVLTGNSTEGYTAKVETIPVQVEEKVAAGTIHRSFSLAAARENVPGEIVDQLVDLFGTRVAFRKEIQTGDQFAIIYEREVLPNGEIAEVGEVEAASFQVGDKFLAAVRYVGSDGKARYFDESGEPLDKHFLRYPVQFTRISSEFAHKRFHPILQKFKPHFGVDFAAPVGTPVRATADGIVTVAGWKGGAGKMIEIKHDPRYKTGYLHLSKIEPGIRTGSKVRRGQVIGRVGMTGLATGPHLHYNFYDNGRHVDPFSAKPVLALASADRIANDYLSDTIDRLTQYHAEQTMAAADIGETTDSKA